MKYYFQKQGFSLRPMDDRTLEKFNKLPQAFILETDLKVVRNARKHALLMVIIRETIQNTNTFKNEEDLLDYIKAETKRFKILNINGKIFHKLSSIAFYNMDETEFDSFFNDAVEICAELHGCTVKELMTRINEIYKKHSQE